MSDALRDLLSEVAQGRVDPAEAARRLQQVDSAAGHPSPPADPWSDATDTADASATPGAATGSEADAADPRTDPQPPSYGTAAPSQPPTAHEPVQRVVVQASARPVRIVADPAVATLTVDGPHTVRHEGSTARVEVPVTPTAGGDGGYRYERKTGLSRWISQATLLGVPLTVRLNPDLQLEVEILTGSVEVTGMHAPVDFSLTAGALRVTDCTGPFVGTVRAGSARFDVRPTSGRSRIRAESGSIDMRLQPGSDARVSARAELGEVKIKDLEGSVRVVQGEGSHEIVFGAGTATVDLEVFMGSVKVRTT